MDCTVFKLHNIKHHYLLVRLTVFNLQTFLVMHLGMMNNNELLPLLFTLFVQVQHKLTEDDVVMETSRQCPTLAVIYRLQEFTK